MIRKAGLGLCFGILALAYGAPPSGAPAAAKEAAGLCSSASNLTPVSGRSCLDKNSEDPCPGERKNFGTGGCMCAPSGSCPELI